MKTLFADDSSGSADAAIVAAGQLPSAGQGTLDQATASEAS
jgi:hypothetical protein